MSSNSNFRGNPSRGGGPGSGFRGGHSNATGGGGRGGAAGNRGGMTGGPAQGSRWGNGPPSSSATASQKNASGPRPGFQNRTSGQQPPAFQGAGTQAGNTTNASAPQAFPSLAGASTPQSESQKTMRDRLMFLLVTLVGNPVTVTVKGGIRYFGIFSAANTEGGDLGVALASAQQILPAKAGDDKMQLGELKRSLIINAKDLESVEAAEIRVQDQAKDMREAREREAFRTDTEISKSYDPLGSGRALQKWSDDPDLAELDDGGKAPAWASPSNGVADGGLTDGATGGKAWDQFAANEARFGIKSDYQETLYTTTLDRSGKDFKAREREADRIAREIMGQATNNPHLAEERGQNDDSGINEEDKYGAVVRNPNAYVPPALRAKQQAAAARNGTAAANAAGQNASSKATSGPAADNTAAAGAATPAVKSAGSVSTTASSAVAAAAPESPAQVIAAPPTVNVKVPSPILPQGPQGKEGNPASKPNSAADAANPLMGDFRQFVSSERERLEKKKAALAKKEKDTRLADLKSWASSFTLKTPMPSDVAEVVHKDKAAKASDQPRDPSLQKSLSPTPSHAGTPASAKPEAGRLSASRPSLATASNAASPTGGSGSAVSAKDGQKLAETKAMLQKMTIPKIPPFNPDKFKARQAAAAAAAAAAENSDSAQASGSNGSGVVPGVPAASTGMPSSISTSSFKLSAKASSFKPFNPNAASFTPGGGSAAAGNTATASPASTSATAKAMAAGASGSPASAAAAAAASAAKPANPFFGNRTLKKPSSGSGSLHVRDDFNSFKVSKVPDAKSVGPMWAFSGKPYRQHFVLATEEGAAMYMVGPSGVMHPGMHPGAPVPQGMPQPPMHPSQMGMGGPAVAGGPGVGMPGPGPAGMPQPQGQQPQGQQPYGMVYAPYGGAGGPYAFHGPQAQQPQPGMAQGRQQPGMPQPPMHLGPNLNVQGGPPMPYGAVPQQFMGQMPFSPAMHQHGGPHPPPPQNMYSPQMAHVPPSQQPTQFMPMHPPPGSAGPGGPRPPPPHLQQQQGGPHGGNGKMQQPGGGVFYPQQHGAPPYAPQQQHTPHGQQQHTPGYAVQAQAGGPAHTPPHRPAMDSPVPASSAASSSAQQEAGN
ncbi:hypothetical protein BCV70DRAFT_112911 [Testicularia cyperi]|uniref:LsmAD domain-containing protein n=1 Tax=Testicularia cyperi TaxID=1882483 RepID=A0A317XQZ5_9BASI|nr:hypothetical protein BCV70DRAFT_112911 [Testicularia cyperi]